MHFCADEFFALLMLIPFVGPWCRACWQRCQKPVCEEHHEEHGE